MSLRKSFCGEALKIKAIVAGFQFPDSVLVYPTTFLSGVPKIRITK
jgi:hypothetical protein